MLGGLLSAQECAECRLCCAFEGYDLFETPTVTRETAQRIVNEKLPCQEFVRVGESYLMKMQCEPDRDLYYCPLLDRERGCIMGDGKPFECRIWPLLVMRRGERLVIALSLAEDGYTLTVPGTDPQAGQWEERDGMVVLDGDEGSALLILDDVLRMDALDLLFGREKPLTYVPADILADAPEGALDGLWRAQFVAVGEGTMLAEAAEEDAFVYIEGANVALGGTRFGNVIRVFTPDAGALTLPEEGVTLQLQQDGFLRMTLADAVIYLMASPLPEA